MFRLRQVWPCLLCLLLLAPAFAVGQQPAVKRFLHLSGLRPGELLEERFALDEETALTVDAIGLIQKHSREYTVHAWILDLLSRRPAWSLDERERESVFGSRLLRRATEPVTLAAGKYSLYLYGAPAWQEDEPFQHWHRLLEDLADLFSREDPGENYESYLDRCHVTLRLPVGGREQVAHVLPLDQWPGRADALIELACAPDDTHFARPFRIIRETSLHLIAMGEASRRGRSDGEGGWESLPPCLLDYGWIEAAEHDETVWQMTGLNSPPAGGAEKNCRFDGELSLPAGDYIAHYATDGSHACGSWNAAPPPDPLSWGLAILPGQEYQPGDLQVITAAEIVRSPDLLVRLLQAGDDEDLRCDFTLDAATRLRVRVLGEGDRSEMFDHGWIVDLDSGRRVWEMTHAGTVHAGGATKNRLCEEMIELGPGRYQARYVSDDSHAFHNWNAIPPAEPHRWGMVITRIPD